MIRQELLELVKFNPQEVRRAIQACHEEANKCAVLQQEALQLAKTYADLLRLYGEPVSATTVDATVTPIKGVIPSERVNGKRSQTIADVAVDILQMRSGRSHAGAILAELQGRGLLREAKYPMTSLTSIMRRDSRIEKIRNKRNWWRLRMSD